MKLFIIKKRNLILFIIIFFIAILVFFNFAFRAIPTSAIELNYDYIISREAKNKIQSLVKSEEKIAYLTFDDGPNPSITPKVLDILQKENIKATFFVIGKNVDTYPDIVKRAYNEGHYIANHGYDHNNNIYIKVMKAL